MATLLLLLLLSTMATHSSATWCICKNGVSESVLQKTLDYACGAGADCNPTHKTGACFAPNTVKSHCDYAVNSYFQKKGQALGACDFTGTAIVSTSDPSTTGCMYPSTTSVGTTSTSTTTTPFGSTSSSGMVGGGIGTGGISSPGVGMNESHGGLKLQYDSNMLSLILVSCLMLCWY